MKKLILITGDLATGKSTFAKILSERYNCTLLYKDEIKEILGDTVGAKNREENLKLSHATMEIMTYVFSSMTRLGFDCILEANFKEHEIEKLQKIAADNEYEVITLVFRADMDIIYKRFVNRIENENRHPIHTSGFDGYDSLKYYIDRGREQIIHGRKIDIDANDFSYQTNDGLLYSIDEFMR